MVQEVESYISALSIWKKSCNSYLIHLFFFALMICFNWCRAKPLAFYIFTCNKKERKLLIENIPCGGITCNDTIMHAGGKISQTELNQLD